MIQFLARRLIRDRDNVTDPAVRRAYGVLCGCVGIALNLVLFAGKLLAGILSGSIAITADAFNNLCWASSWPPRPPTATTPSATGGWSMCPAWWYPW